MKKCKLSSDQLKPALKKLALAVPDKPVFPVLKNIYCKVEKDTMEMIATDKEITISVTIAAETEGAPFELLIPFDFINRITGLISRNQPVTIEHPSTRKARLITGEDIDELNNLDKPEEYPKLPGIPKKGGNLKLTKDFIEMLSLAMLTAGKNEMQPALTAACLDIQKEGAWLVTTDAFSLYRHKIDISCEEPQQLLFTAKIADALNGLAETELSWNSNQICVKATDIIIWSTRLDVKYPNYNAVIPKDWPANLVLEKEPLAHALQKACLSSSATKQTDLQLKEKAGSIRLVTKDIDMERVYNSTLAAEYSGDTPAVSLNAKKLLTMLKQFEGEKLSLAIHNSKKAVLVRSEDDQNYLGLIMPLVVD